MLLACKGLAYGVALSSFRGGPVFPGMFLGAVGGIALSHLPGLPMIAGVAMGIGAMTVAMLNLPLVSVLLVVLFLRQDGVAMMPVVIIARRRVLRGLGPPPTHHPRAGASRPEPEVGPEPAST